MNPQFVYKKYNLYLKIIGMRTKLIAEAVSNKSAKTIADILSSLLGNKCSESMLAFLWAMRVVINFSSNKGVVTAYARHAAGYEKMLFWSIDSLVYKFFVSRHVFCAEYKNHIHFCRLVLNFFL